MTAAERPHAAWLDVAAAVGVAGITGTVLDACAGVGGVPTPNPQRILVPEPPGGWADPRLLGWVHEWSVTGSRRDERGAHYTPPAFAAEVVTAALAGMDLPQFTVDPACGGGVFLLEILDRLHAAGVPPTAAVDRVAGLEIDPAAATVARDALLAWQLARGVSAAVVPRIATGDALDPWPRTWPAPDLVIGNPPFASPLKSGAIPEPAVRYRNHHAEVLGPYADLAAIHLWRALDAVADGGRVAFVAPMSLINARDTTRLWRRLETQADTLAVLIPDTNPFDASVRVFVPVIEVRRAQQTERRSLGHAVAAALGIPDITGFDDAPTLESIAQATSGFRDEFYGLARHATEESELPAGADRRRLITVGAIEPLDCRWGRQLIRFAKQRWDRPTIDARDLDRRLQVFVERQHCPKVLLATQSTILEPIVDPIGDLVGVTPTVIVTGERPHHIAAVLLAPPVVALAAQRWFGTGLSDTALRPTASTVLDLPLPGDHDRWDRAAGLIADASPAVDGHQSPAGRDRLIEIAALMTAAYGAPPSMLDWWIDRAGLGE